MTKKIEFEFVMDNPGEMRPVPMVNEWGSGVLEVGPMLTEEEVADQFDKVYPE